MGNYKLIVRDIIPSSPTDPFDISTEIFASWEPSDQNNQLHAWLRLADVEDGKGDYESSLRTYQRIAFLVEKIFTKLSPDVQALVLIARVNAGVTHSESLNSPLSALAEYTQVAQLAEWNFNKLSSAAQVQALYARAYAGFIHSRSLNSPLSALHEYTQVVQLAEGCFNELAPGAQEKVLIAHVNAGVIHHEVLDSPLSALSEYTQVAQLAESNFNQLHPVVQLQVLIARLNAGHTYNSSLNAPLSALTEYTQVAQLAEWCFGQLVSEAQEEVLKARYRAGVIQMELNSPLAALQEFTQVAKLAGGSFNELRSETQVLVLSSLISAGTIHAENLNSPQAALLELAQVAKLAEGCFGRLAPDVQHAVLMARVNAGKIQMDLNSPHAALHEYAQVEHLAECDFGQLSSEAQEEVLKARFNAGFTHSTYLNSLHAALHEYAQVGQLAECCFGQLSSVAQGEVLKARYSAGLIQEKLNSPLAALLEYTQVAKLAECSFNQLSPYAKGLVLAARVSAGFNYCVPLNSPHDALLEYTQVAQLAEHYFDQLSSEAKWAVLMARARSGQIHQQYLGSPHSALIEYTQIAKLGEPYFRQLDLKSKCVVIEGICRTFTISETDYSKFIQATALSWLDLHEKSGETLKILTKTRYKLNSSQINFSNTWYAAHHWLSRLDAYPTLPTRAVQTASLLVVAEGIAAEILRRSKSISKRIAEISLTERYTNPTEWAALSQTIANAICKCQNFATRFSQPNHWLFAVLYSKDASACPSSDKLEWEPDMPNVWKALQSAQLFLDNGSIQSPHFWHKSRLETWRLDVSANDPTALDPIMLNGNSELARNALVEAWRDIKFGGNDRLFNTNGWISDLDEVAQLLSKFDVCNATEIAWEAIIYRDVDNVIAKHLLQWINRQLEEAHQDTQGNQFNELLMRLMFEVDPLQDDLKILELLHRFINATIHVQSNDPAVVWHLLEVSRVVLCSVANIASNPIPQQPDETALNAIRKATQDILSRNLLLAKIASEGQAVETPDDSDLPIEPYATLGREMDRLGHKLNIVTPQDAASQLEPNEHLVQLHWDANGIGYALWLQTSTGLRSIELPNKLNYLGWQALLAPWQKALTSPIGDLKTNLQAFQDAWDRLVSAQSPALNLLTWLSTIAGADAQDQRIIVIFPDCLSRLPWFALLSNSAGLNLTLKPSQLELAVSVSAWHGTRLRTHEGSHKFVQGSSFGQVLIDSEDSSFKHGTVGEREAIHVSQFFGGVNTISHGVTKVLSALQTSESTHLIMHGAFNPFNPSKSFLKVGNSDHKITATMLSGCRVSGDISLASCSAMMASQGQGEAQYLGPVGLGAVLSAAGARSVVGTLWEATPWISFLFYSLWFEERRTQTASVALATVQKRMQELTFEETMRFARKFAPEHVASAVSYISTTKSLGWPSPFHHPWCFAGYTLLGDAPPLPALKKIHRLPKWLSWCLELFERIILRRFKTQQKISSDAVISQLS